MNWVTLAPLLLSLLEKYGPEVVAAISGIFSSPTAPSQAQWDGLIALSKNSARSNMLQALVAAGIDPNSDQGKAFLALTPP
jgi:hypothetical protein